MLLKHLVGMLSREDGVAAIEFGLLLPILALLFAGTVEVGWALNNYVTIVNVSRDGARQAAGSLEALTNAQALPVVTTLVQREAARLPGGITAGNVTLTTESVGSGTNDGRRVRVCYSHQLLVGGLVPTIFNPLNMCASTAMPCLAPPCGP